MDHQVVFIAGPFAGNVEENIKTAKAYSEKLWRAGIPNICPHANSGFLEHLDEELRSNFINGYIEILSRCDVILMLPNWQNSSGARKEHEFAMATEIRVLYANNLEEFTFEH